MACALLHSTRTTDAAPAAIGRAISDAPWIRIVQPAAASASSHPARSFRWPSAPEDLHNQHYRTRRPEARTAAADPARIALRLERASHREDAQGRCDPHRDEPTSSPAPDVLVGLAWPVVSTRTHRPS
jgi:hypothetical protein